MMVASRLSSPPMTTTRAYALLVPIPHIHLIAGQQVCQQQGKVAFGSRETRLFRHLDLSRYKDEVDIFITSTTPERAIETQITWHGIYIGHVQAEGTGTHPDKARYRPYTDYENDHPGRWWLFWEVRELQPISPLPIHTLKRFDQKQPFEPDFAPDKPLLIEHPYPRQPVQVFSL